MRHRSIADVKRLIRRLVNAWKTGDRAGFGSCFTPGARYRTGDGALLHGRAEIEDIVPGKTSGTPIQVEDLTVALTDEGAAATARFRWDVHDAAGGQRRGTITCHLVGENDDWLIDQLDNLEER